jgi:hypothetical protein
MTENDAVAELIAELKQLKIRELQVLSSLESLIQLNHPYLTTTNVVPTPGRVPTFTVGDRVVITNKTKRPLNRPTNKGDKTAIVIHVAPTRIDIITSNGTTTWRSPNNLRARRIDE